MSTPSVPDEDPTAPSVAVVTTEDARYHELSRLLHGCGLRCQRLPARLTTVRESDASVLILDCSSDTEPGWGLLTEHKPSSESHQRWVALVSETDGTLQRAWTLGAADCITLPLRPAEFAARIENQLKKSCWQALFPGSAEAVEQSLRSLESEFRPTPNAQLSTEQRVQMFLSYAEFFKDSTYGVLVIDRTGKILFANSIARSLAALDGRPRRSNVLDFLPAEERRRAALIGRDLTLGNYPKGIDFQVLLDEQPRVLQVHFSATLANEGAVLLTFRDVTKERTTEHELKQTKEFLERVIDSSVDAIVAADMTGQVLLFNRAASRIFGYEPQEVVRKMNVERLYPPHVAREVMRKIRGIEYGGRDRLEEYQVSMQDSKGRLIPVRISAALIRDGKIARGTVGIFKDVRDELRMQVRLQEAQQAIREHERDMAVAQLAGATAHELNQPLTAVMSYAEMLMRKLSADDPLFGAASVIAEQAERMANIVRHIGRITRYETKSYVGDAKILDLEKASRTDDRDSSPPESSAD